MTDNEAKKIIDDMPQELRDVAAQYAFAGDPVRMVLLLAPYIIEQLKDTEDHAPADDSVCMDMHPETEAVRDRYSKMMKLLGWQPGTRTLPEPWRDPAEEWPEDGHDILVAYTWKGHRCVRETFVANGKVHTKQGWGAWWTKSDLTVQNSRFDAWKPMPSHPFDNEPAAS